MSKLPKYLNCKNEKLYVCPYYMHKLCKETCFYAHDIRGLGIGAMCDTEPFKKLEDLNNETNTTPKNNLL